MNGDPPPRPVRKPHRRIIRTLIVLVILLLISLFFVWAGTPPKSLVWLTPAQLANAPKEQPKLVAYAKSAYESLVRFLPHKRLTDVIEFHMVELAPTTPEQLALGHPYSTNNAGIRAWFLNQNQLSTFLRRIKAIPGGTNIATLTLTLEGDLQNDVPMLYFVPNQPDQSAFFGLDLNFDARVAGKSVKIVMEVTPLDGLSNSLPFECEANIPFGHGLVFDHGDGCWFLACPDSERSFSRAVKK